MKTLRLSLVVALSALGLQACDVNVKPAEHAAGAPQETAIAPQPAAPVDATPTPVQSGEASAPASPPVAAADPNAAPVGAAAPVGPETNAMGAQPEVTPAAEADGVAAPTELARFLEQNVIKQKAP